MDTVELTRWCIDMRRGTDGKSEKAEAARLEKEEEIESEKGVNS